MPRALPRYEITFTKRGAQSTALESDTQVRRAIRRARQALRWKDAGWQVTVRGWAPGSTAQRGRVEFQAHLGADRKIHIEER